MAPAAASTTPSSTSAKRPAGSDAEPPLDSSALPVPVPVPPQAADEAARGSQHQPRQQLQCPRCASTNTKFCYYNNYSTAQPRHFCRACRRYWTQGGTLRDVPVGGAPRRTGTTKRRRLSLSAEPPPTTTTATAAARADDVFPPADLLAFPFLSDGSLLPQFDHGVAPPPVSWPSLLPDFYAAPWDDCTFGAAGVTGAWADMASLELSWPPPGN